MKTRTGSRMLRGLVGAVAVAVLIVPTAAAKGPGGGGGGGEETTSHSLSVPALFVGGTNPFGLACDGTSTSPDGQTPATGFEVPGYYYVQGVNTWQASCDDAVVAATATVAWGDNLGGDAKLKVGSPIRVEIGLLTVTPTDFTGWDVVKLMPSQLDRVSPYGTLAEPDGLGGFLSQPSTPYSETRVWDSGAWLKIWKVGSELTPVVDQAAGSEVNATGKVVYGHNLRVTSTGDYVIEYTFPGVTLTGTDIGDFTDHTATLTIPVISGGGGGGGRR